MNYQTPDSASTATAIVTGVKTITHTLGYDYKIVEGDASSISNATELKSILGMFPMTSLHLGTYNTLKISKLSKRRKH